MCHHRCTRRDSRQGARSAAEAELAKIFPDAPNPLPVIGPIDPIYTAAGADFAASTVEYRRYQRTHGSSHAPGLRRYTLNGRTAVIYSPEDLSTGLVGQPLDGIAGYSPADAVKIAADVVAFAAKKK